MVHRAFQDPLPLVEPLGGLALHDGSKNDHHPYTQLNNDEAYKSMHRFT